MDQRENVLSLFRRQGYREVPVHVNLCPSLEERFREHTGFAGDPWDYFGVPWRHIGGLRAEPVPDESYRGYYGPGLKPGAEIDDFGVAHEPGSASAMHMTRMRHPLKHADSLEQIQAYPLPDYSRADGSHQKAEVEALHARGLAACGGMGCSVWETAWYIRGMEELMADMMDDDPKAVCLLDRLTDICVRQAEAAARAGVDLIYWGDDIGTQRAPMMSVPFYSQWLKPRHQRAIDAAKAIKPDIIVIYHSCGYVVPFIPHLIEAGVDVLNPVQPECMDFAALHAEYGGALSFHGTVGTQTTMPFGTPEDVRQTVFRNLGIAGRAGGLMPAPTHLLEPEVPLENVFAYAQACRDYCR